MWLSAGDTDRHLGVMDQGAIVDPPADVRDGITILDDHTHLSWLALTDWSTKKNSRGVRVVADGVRLDHLFLYNEGSTVSDPDGVGIFLEENNATLWVSHSIVSGVSRSGFSARGEDQIVTTQNATIEVYASAVAHTGYEDSNNNGAGFDGNEGSGTKLRVFSTIGFHKAGSNRAVFRGLQPTFNGSKDNISDDASAGTLGIGTPSSTLVTLIENGSPELIDFHWKSDVTCLAGANLVLAGLLTAEEAVDINGEARPTTGRWCAGPHQDLPNESP